MMKCLSEILKNGNIDPLQFGIDVSSVVALIGEPDGEFKSESNDVLKYGAIQFFFEAGLLAKAVFGLTKPMAILLPETILVVSSKTTVEEFVGVCDTLEIPWSINQSLTFDRQLCLSTNPNTSVFFDLDHRELSKIQVTR